MASSPQDRTNQKLEGALCCLSSVLWLAKHLGTSQIFLSLIFSLSSEGTMRLDFVLMQSESSWLLERGCEEGQSVKSHIAPICINAKVAFLGLTSDNLVGCQKSAISIWKMFCRELQPKVVVYHLGPDRNVYSPPPLLLSPLDFRLAQPIGYRSWKIFLALCHRIYEPKQLWN